MNDEFLHRIRKTPPPEFLAGLKARLDRQPHAPAGAPHRRWTFTRGLITGLLLGGAAFALTAVSLTRGPQSLRSLVKVPVEYFARLMSGGNGPGQEEVQGQHHAVPLGPVWLPDHTAGSSGKPPKVPTQSTGFAVKQDNPSGSPGSVAPGSGSVVAKSGGGFPAYETITVVASPDAYPFALATSKIVPRTGYHMFVERDTGNALDRLCNSDSPMPVEAALLSRRITPNELRRCTRGGTRLVEIKVGYEAIALARARLYGPLRLTARALFLALARRIPDPAHPGKLINNPNTTWNQVDSALPYDPIQVIGPDRGSDAGKLAAHLLLQSGCNSYQWIAALGDSDPQGYADICGTLRSDGAYIQGDVSLWTYFNMLVTNPTLLGIYALNESTLDEFPSRSQSALLLNPVDLIDPTPSALMAETYPIAETLYLYANKSRVAANHAFMPVVRIVLAPKYLYTVYSSYAFMALGSADHDAMIANAEALKELQF